MKIAKSLLGGVVFFLSYIGVDYLIDKKIDYTMAISMAVVYAVASFIFEKKKK